MIRCIAMLCVLFISVTSVAEEVDLAAQVDREASFFEQLDLTPLNGVAVWQEGRFKSFESAARSTLDFISGPRSPGGAAP